MCLWLSACVKQAEPREELFSFSFLFNFDSTDMSLSKFREMVKDILAALGLCCSTWALGRNSLFSLRCTKSAAFRLTSCGTWAQLLQGSWNLSSPTRDGTWVSYIGRRILYHWTTRQVPIFLFLTEHWLVSWDNPRNWVEAIGEWESEKHYEEKEIVFILQIRKLTPRFRV